MSTTVPSKRISKRQAIALLLSRQGDVGRHPAVREGVRIVPSQASK